MPKTTLTILLILLALQTHAQSDSLFQKFRTDILQEQEAHNGRTIWDDETKASYYRLLSTSTVEDLIKYTDDPIPAVRAAIFSGLVNKSADDKILRAIIEKHTNDTATYISAPTDVVTTWSVIEHMHLGLEYKARGQSPIDYKARQKETQNSFCILIPGAHHGLIPKDSLLKLDSLTYSEKGFRIRSFTVTVGKKAMASKANLFTKEMKQAFKRLKMGHSVYIENIHAQVPDGSIRILNSLVLKIARTTIL